MPLSKIGAALVAVLAIAGCSQKPTATTSASSAAVTPASADPAAVTIAIPANQEVTKIFPLPPGTHKVGIKTGAAGFACDHMAFVTDNGGRSNNFTDADVPANLNMTDSTSVGTYVSVDLQCHGGAAASQLVMTPSP
ncbi:MAG: hypothetical protein ACREEB_12860 [Caulobacteraceae bacterium]